MRERTVRAGRYLLPLLLTSAGAAMAGPKYDHHVRLTPENSVFGNFPAQKAAILTIQSGDTVRFDTGGGAGWQRGNQDPGAWLEANDIPLTADDPVVKEVIEVIAKTRHYGGIERGHFLVGPVAIEGAMPGDSIEVRVHSLAAA
jgi:acetamidase/formamidase